jgi:type III secretion protein SpaR/YscT/HrcT
MGEGYVTVFLNSSIATNPQAALTLLFLFLARMLPIIALSPFFGARVLPHPVKVFFAITLFFIFLPDLMRVTTSTTLGFDLWSMFLFIKELFIGYLLGFFISLPFQIAQSAGIIIDHQRGGASLMVNDPTIQNQSSPLGTMFNMVLIFIFFYIDGPFLFIDTLISSYEVIPPDAMLNPRFFAEGSPFWDREMSILNEVMVIAIRLASPALIAILMTDVFLGIANRLAPQVQITFLGLPLKSLLGLAVLTIGWKTFAQELSRQGFYWIQEIQNLLVMFKVGQTP